MRKAAENELVSTRLAELFAANPFSEPFAKVDAAVAAKQAFAGEAVARNMLVFFEHDPLVPAGYLKEEGGKRRAVPA